MSYTPRWIEESETAQNTCSVLLLQVETGISKNSCSIHSTIRVSDAGAGLNIL